MKMPNTGTSTHRAALVLRVQGPMPRQQLFEHPAIGSTRLARESTLSRAINLGWFVLSTDGDVSLSHALATHLDEKLGPVEPASATQSIAEIRTSDFRTAKTYKSNLNPRGTRADIPEWSQRQDGFSFKSPFSTREA